MKLPNSSVIYWTQGLVDDGVIDGVWVLVGVIVLVGVTVCVGVVVFVGVGVIQGLISEII